MRRRRGLTLASTTVLVAASLHVAPGRADSTKDQCIQANGTGQDLFHDGKLTAARVQLQSCAAASCPAMIRDDCVKRLDELDKVQPAVVFFARDPADNDLSAVSITVDGVRLASKLDGTPLKVDPGEHVFVFTVAGSPPVTRKLVIAERDHSRRERIQFEAAAVAPGTGTEAPPSSPSAPERGSTLRMAGLITGGAGVVGIGVGSVFGLMTGSAYSSQKNDCASALNCPHHGQALDDHSAALTDGTIATVAFVAGGALLVAGAAMYLLGGHRSEPATTGLLVAPSVGPSSAGVLLRGAF